MNHSKLNIRFLGGAGTVTGSKFLVTYETTNVLIDCGMFQGLKELRNLNRMPLPIEANLIDSVILTHAHLDHTGHLPLLVKEGFKGKIHCTAPTLALAEIILRDTAHIQEEDAELINRLGYSKHKPAIPLYGTRDVEFTLPHFHVEPLNQWININEKIKFRFRLSGHILGSAFIELDCGDQRIVFSGDLGRSKPLTLNPPSRLEIADYILIESTYGDRKHPKEDIYQRLSKIITDTISRGGQVLIPSFAVGRTQDMLYVISKLKASNAIPKSLPVYLDSPMAVKTTKVFDGFDEWHKLGSDDLLALGSGVTIVGDSEQSKKLQEDTRPAIIIAGSGMMTGGRILAHARKKISNSKNTFIMAGFQAAGTLGRFVKEGSDEIKIFGEYVPINAQIENIDSFSAHADQSEIIDWLRGFSKPPKKIFIVHGEPHSANALRVRIRDELGWEVWVPEMGSNSPL